MFAGLNFYVDNKWISKHFNKDSIIFALQFEKKKTKLERWFKIFTYIFKSDNYLYIRYKAA